MTFNEQQQRLQAIIAPLPVAAATFLPNSRYYGSATSVFGADSGRSIIYLRRRIVPAPEALARIGEYVVADGERPDQIAAAVLGDPELFWRLCDGNRAVFPDEIAAEAGRRLRVTLPSGIPGVSS